MSAEGPADELRRRIAESPFQPGEIARFLDSSSHEERVAAVRALGRGDQRRLYEGVSGFLPIALADIVPPGVGDMESVRHFGRNTLPAFQLFEKRFCRPADADREKPEQLWGFNFQSMAWVTGPGYFVARSAPDRPEVLVDYNLVPQDHPAGWPDVRSNEKGLSRFVYGFMIDTLRRVSEHVSIGSAARKGKDMGSWFVLARQDQPDA